MFQSVRWCLVFATLTFATSAWQTPLAYGQASIRTMTDVIDRWVAEKRKCISFNASCSCDGIPSSWKKLVKESNAASALEVEFEYMSFGKHFLTKVRPRSENKGAAWQFCGPSQRYLISGFSNDAVLVGYSTAVPEWAFGRSDFFLFDPLAIGLGSMQALDQGVEHMTLLGILRRSTMQKDMWDVKDYGEKIVARSRNGILIVANRDKGYLPIEFATDNEDGSSEKWAVEYDQIGGCWLPTHAVLNTRNGDITTEFKFDLRWRSINQPMTTGLKAAERLGTKFDIRVVEF